MTFIIATILQKAYSDQELNILLKSDSEAAIEWMFKRYYAFLCQTVYKIIPNGDVAEDIIQELFADLWRKREQLEFTGSIQGYLRRAAVNKTLNFIRDNKFRFEEEEQIAQMPSNHSPAGALVEMTELQEAIDKAVDALPERCRIVFALSRFEQFSHQEIAQQLGISVKTVENQITKALRILRDELEPYIKTDS
ncbi:MAG: RNA polymerase sigma-70 factor [Saprospiraceae bacterium]|nr:RNA polymerase sigma-70 factor [Saprospiraceae bacterium]